MSLKVQKINVLPKCKVGSIARLCFVSQSPKLCLPIYFLCNHILVRGGIQTIDSKTVLIFILIY